MVLDTRILCWRFWRNRLCQIFIFLFAAALFLYLTDLRPKLELNDDSLRLSWKAAQEAAAKKRRRTEVLNDDQVAPIVGLKQDDQDDHDHHRRRQDHGHAGGGGRGGKKCKIPRLDPFDPSVIPFVTHPRTTECARIQPDLAFVDPDGVLRLNSDAVREYESAGKTRLYCHYRYFVRGKVDAEVVIHDPVPLAAAKPVKLKSKFVKVSCFEGDKGSNGTKIYANIFAYPVPSPTQLPAKPLSPDGEEMNVFVLCFESTSLSSAYRHLPKLMKYLHDETEAVVFNSYNTVGENSLENLAALLTGKRSHRREQFDMPAELPAPKEAGLFYDDWPMIWNRYQSEKGYETVYVEDHPMVSTWHYGAGGFRHRPVDYWYFPFWEQMRLSLAGEPVAEKSSPFCFGNDPVHQTFAQILFRHLDRSQQRRLFLFAKFNQLSHDHTSDLERSDDIWTALLRKADADRLLNRTVLIVMGDHGPRYTATRRTAVGYVEERLPLLVVRLPPALRNRYPKLQDTLRGNRHRLTTPFDVHETLLDILYRKFDGSIPPPSSSSSKEQLRNRSLLRGPWSPAGAEEEDRTCAQAGVPDRYCLCDGVTVKNRDEPRAWKAARVVNDELNRRVQKRFAEQCAPTKVDKIEYYIRIDDRHDDNDEKANRKKTYVVGFTVEPLRGRFEGFVTRNGGADDKDDTTITYVEGTLERISPPHSLPGGPNQPPPCVPDPAMMKFCACKAQLLRIGDDGDKKRKT